METVENMTTTSNVIVTERNGIAIAAVEKSPETEKKDESTLIINEKCERKLSDYQTLASSEDEVREVALHLHSLGCCPRCILRLVGEQRHTSYYTPQQVLIKLFLPESHWSVKSGPCPACLGILQQFSEVEFFQKIVEKVKEENYEFNNHMCSLQVPVALMIREKSLFLHLKRKFEKLYKGKEDRISPVKEVWKWVCGPPIAKMIGSSFQTRSDFDILMNFSYPDSDKECGFLLDVNPDTFRKRKQRKYGFETFTRANVGKAIYKMDGAVLEKHTKCPPAPPTVECSVVISCSHEAVYVAGRYQKYSRNLSQSPWWVGDERIMESSVQELICEPMSESFKPTDHKFSSSGREDVDVRTLGLGRPFMVELINPHCTRFSRQDMADLQKRINASTKDIQVRDLQVVSREESGGIRVGEIEKTKAYCAYCWCERDLTDADLDKLTNIKDLTIHQKTPLRVLHRRTLINRERMIHSMTAEKTSAHTFKLTMSTQAGTYIKEFVHGDFGRTTPNLCTLLATDCDITDLDVTQVDVDWPPYIDEKTPSSLEPAISPPDVVMETLQKSSDIAT